MKSFVANVVTQVPKLSRVTSLLQKRSLKNTWFSYNTAKEILYKGLTTRTDTKKQLGEISSHKFVGPRAKSLFGKYECYSLASFQDASPYSHSLRLSKALLNKPGSVQLARLFCSGNSPKEEQSKKKNEQKDASSNAKNSTESEKDAERTGFGRFYPKSRKLKEKQSSEGYSSSSGEEKSDEKGGGLNGFPGGSQYQLFAFLIGTGLLLSVVSSSGQDGGSRAPETSWQAFRRDILPTGRVSKIVVVNKDVARVYARNANSKLGDPNVEICYFRIGDLETFENKLQDAQEDLGFSPKEIVPVVYSNETSLLSTVIAWSPTILLILVYLYFLRTGGFGPMAGGIGGPGSRSSSSSASRNIFGVGKANVTVMNRDTNKVSTTFKDVAGLDEAKTEVMEFVYYLKNPERYKEIGAKIPKGALLYGPPGTGKTLLAKATAGESGVPFLTMSGSDFMEMFVGVGPSRVRDLFAQARKLAPCIIFIDEIDAIGRARGRGGLIGGNDERENTLNQLLVEMDGFSPNSGVVVFGGTNRADILDNALLRPGRFDRQILIDAPDIRGRHDIFLVHLRPLKVSDPPGIEKIAQRLAALTPGFVGADIANVCNEGALVAARESVNKIELRHFEAAIDRVIGGLEKRNMVMSPEEKKTVAYHEAGHAVAGWFLRYALPLLKVSIVPRGSSALGYSQYQPREQYLYSKEQLLDTICMTLGGRVSEEIFFQRLTTGAADDFQKVTRLAYQEISVWGMNDTVGHVSFPKNPNETRFYKPYSDRTAASIDREVRDLLFSAYKRTYDLLLEKKEDIEKVAELLLEREQIGYEDLVRILGKRPFEEVRDYEDILEQSKKVVQSSKQ
ncbi:hypothetical protein GAYE_SCF18G3898 [Galdieria yellowstonensis]|uniref:AAA+ ATPase domain-containing protein n=1 Tax=Galdieria yellowstonensis TaxID=3028027 RepID=A0AAV9IFA3_9RHOD|nr:hypothetical protein GAYE_SCF18G3898 [Galdieria yellowstonensis]